MRKIIAVWLCALLMFSSVLAVGSNVNEEIEGSDVEGVGPAYTPHVPIRIDSNADFPGIATAGDGSSGDPWIIEDWDIDGTGLGYCIYIGNTTEHFVLRDCLLHHAIGGTGDEYFPDAGAALTNVQSGIIENNTVSSNGKQGITLYSSSSNIIENNIAQYNSYGIGLIFSNGNTIANNTASDNWCGIQLDSSDNNWVYHNNIINNTNQADDTSGNNFWNATYPLGGNYWNDYAGIDVFAGPNQDLPGVDGLGDAPYNNIGGAGNQDNYPLMQPWPCIIGHPLIRINSNTDFDEAHGVVNWATGAGSAGNPWIIEGYDINGTGYGYCIYIGNTTEHFVVRNCTLHDANGNSARYYWDSGLVLFKVQNGTIDSNNISSNERDGIYFGLGCRYNLISNNNITSNTGNGIYFAPSGTRKITDNLYEDSNPQLNNLGEVAWSGEYSIFLDPEIFIWDGINTTRISGLGIDDDYPQINDNGEVAWQGYWSGTNEVFLWDGVDRTYISNMSIINQPPQINNNGEVVWQGLEPGDNEIFYWDGLVTTKLTDNFLDDKAPQINENGDVVWYGDDVSDDEIYLWNGTSTIQVTNNSIDDRDPQINDNGEVVWVGWNGSSEIFFWDGVNTTQITNDSNIDEAPQINDNGEVVWQGGNEIFFWDGVTTNQLTNNTLWDWNPQINNNGEVTWDCSIPFGSNWEIFLWDGSTTIQITNNSYQDYYPQINNKGELVWTGIDDIDREIFYYYGPRTTCNTISHNKITSNNNCGIYLNYSNYNTINNNIISMNTVGISLSHSTGNILYHNNLIDNTNQAIDYTETNLWNNTYPLGGNYWSDYIGVDFNCTPAQDVPPPDGFGDTPYINISGGGGAVDNYPLMNPCNELDIYPPNHYNEFPAPGSIIDDGTPTISVIVLDTSGIDTSTIRLYVNSFPVFYSLDPFTTGYNVSYWHSGGFSPGEVVTCRIVTEDIHGNELDFTWNFTVDSGTDVTPPDHSNEYPPIDGNSLNVTPVISVHVTDNSGVNSSTIRLYVQGFSVFYSLAPITDGYNVSYYYEAGFTPGEVVTCRIVAEDIYANLQDFTWEFTVLYAFSKPLVSGWNFLSIPVIPYNGTVFDSISGKWDYIQHYDASDDNDHWKTYSIYKPPSLNDLWSLSLHWGFWLHTTEACTWYLNGTLLGPTGIQLYAGWNMVGYPTFTEKSISEALAGTGYDRPVETFNATAPYRIGPLADTYMMKPGEGYWVHVPADTVWVVDW